MIDYTFFICFAGIGFGYLLILGLFELINYLTKGKFRDFVVNLFSDDINKN